MDIFWNYTIVKNLKSTSEEKSEKFGCLPLLKLEDSEFERTPQISINSSCPDNHCLMHRMQIWRTTRSAPGTNCMKVRIVRPWCFVLFILPLSSLASWTV